ncbi:MAG: GNAT family N-acetyltransferase [Acetobacteraceae bacterium]|nr:GNAT family N-acetyltransferase [Acetobacteraceae bacterium]
MSVPPIRPARPDEGEALAALLRVSFTPYARALGREVTPAAYARLAEAHRNGDVHVAEQEGALAGLVALMRHGETLEVDLLCVHPDHQKRGLGRALLAEAERIARGGGFSRIELHTAAMFGHLLRLYESVGYRETHRGLPPHGADSHPRVFFAKGLLATTS